MNPAIFELTWQNIWNWFLFIFYIYLIAKISYDYIKRGKKLKSTTKINKALIDRVDKLEAEIEKLESEKFQREA